MSEKTLRASVEDQLEDEFEVPADYEADLGKFREACDSSGAEVWEIPLADMLVLFEKALMKNVYYKD